MAVFDPRVTTADAERGIQAKQNVGKTRYVPPILPEVREVMNRRVHVFNVGPWGQTINTGSTGTFIVPACPFGTPYVEMLEEDRDPQSETYKKKVPPIKRIMRELVIQSEDAMSPLDDSGIYFAWQMLGVGRGMHPAKALTRFGMFVGEGDKPTKEELEKAHAALQEECRAICKFAADTFVTDRQLFSRAVRPEVHFVAAKVLGRDNEVDSPWMVASQPVNRVKCKVCGRACDSEVAMCEGGHIINMEKYLEYKALEETIAAAVAKPKRG